MNHAKMQWLQNPNQKNADNLNNVRREASRHVRNKMKEYMKVKIDKIETNSKIENMRDLYRDINDFKKGYRPRNNTVDLVPIYKKDVKAECGNYTGISLLPITYKILSYILLSRLTLFAEEIVGDHQCGFRSFRSTIDHIFCTRQILEKKWEYNEAVNQLFNYFVKFYDSVRRDVLYNILIKSGIPTKLVRLINCGEFFDNLRTG